MLKSKYTKEDCMIRVSAPSEELNLQIDIHEELLLRNCEKYQVVKGHHFELTKIIFGTIHFPISIF